MFYEINLDRCLEKWQIKYINIRESVDEEQYIKTGAQRAAGWCKAAERIYGTRLGASVRNPLGKVDADGIHRYMEQI